MCTISKCESGNQDSQNVCFFCYKTSVPIENADVLNNFKIFAGRFIGDGFKDSLNAAENEILKFTVKRSRGGLECCDSCEILLCSFCELYDKLKCLELRLEWRLKGLLDIMKLANRVPSRVQHLKRLFSLETGITQKSETDFETEKGRSRLNNFKDYRADVIRKCSQKLSRSLPKVLVTRMKENFTYRPPLTNNVKNDPKSEPRDALQPEIEEWFLRWTISLVTVGMLLVTAEQNLTTGFPVESQITDSSIDDLPENSFQSEWVCADSNSENESTTTNPNDNIAKNSDTIIDQCPSSHLLETETIGIQISDAVNPQLQKFIRQKQAHHRKRFQRHKKYSSNSLKIFHCSLCKSRYLIYRNLQIHKLTSNRHHKLLHISRKTKLKTAKKRKSRSKVTSSSNSKSTFNSSTECNPKLELESLNNIKREREECENENIENVSTIEENSKFPSHQRYNFRRKRSCKPIKEESDLEESDYSDFEISNSDSDLSSSSLSEHENITQEENKAENFKCGICKLKVPRYFIENHFKIWHKSSDFKPDSKNARICPVSGCSAYFIIGHNRKGARVKLALHKKQVHGLILKVKCEIGKKKVKSRAKNVKAGKKRVKIEPPECDDIDKVSMYKCSQCKAVGISRTFRLQINYDNHQKFHKAGKFKCKFCDLVELDIVALSTHEINNHSPDQRDSTEKEIFSCPRCKTEHYSNWLYIEHFADTHIPDFEFTSTSTKVECDVCHFELFKLNLEKHFRSFHNRRSLGSKETLKCTFPSCQAFFAGKTTPAYANYQLQLHIRQVHENIPEFQNFDSYELTTSKKKPWFKCKLCGNSFANKRGIYLHTLYCRRRKRSSTNSPSLPSYETYVFQCPVQKCQSNFGTREDLQQHKKYHGKFTCKFCNVVKDYAPDLASHEASEHSEKVEDSNICCSRCPLKFHFKPAFIDHFLEKHLKLRNPRIGYCTICGAETVRAQKNKFLNIHFQQNHKTEGLEPKDIHRCDQCPAYFIKSLQLYLHKMNIHLKRKCPGCGKSYDKLHFLKNHMEICKPESLPLNFSCDIENCKKKFLTAERLAHHKRYCRHEEIGKIFKCTKCSKQYPKSGSLQAHIREAHLPKTHLCAECGKGFSKKCKLLLHLKLHQEKDRDSFQFQCTECSVKFEAKNTLTIHMRMHTKEKPFVCQFCGNAYAHGQGLSRHVKASHKGKQSGLNDATKKSL